MIGVVIGGRVCSRWVRAGGAGEEEAVSGAAGEGTAGDGGRSSSWAFEGLPARAGPGEFPASGPLVLAGRSSCPVSCSQDSGGAGGAPGRGAGQRRGRMGRRFLGVSLLWAPLTAPPSGPALPP